MRESESRTSKQQADSFLRSTQHPTLGRGYLACAYEPMVELLRYLEKNGFSNYIASGGGRDFMRPISDELYGIPRDRVIGSSTALDYVGDDNGGAIIRKPEADVLDDGPQKPVRIWSRVGRRPLLAAGNSNGDIQMLDFAQHATKPTLRLLVLHDDAEREFDYTAGCRESARAGADGALDRGQHGKGLVDRLPGRVTVDDMVHVGGTTFRMGSDAHYPEEAPAHLVGVDDFWIDKLHGDELGVRLLRRADGLRDGRRAAAGPERLPRRTAGEPRARLARLHQNGRARRPAPSQRLVDVDTGCVLDASGRTGELDRRARRSPRRARRLRGRRGVRRLGRQGAAERGGVGARSARRTRGVRIRLGRPAGGARRATRQLLARRLPLASRARLRRAHAGRLVPGERARVVRHGGQRLGVDERLVQPSTSERSRQAVLCAAESARAGHRVELRRRTTAVSDSAQGGQGRLVSLRRQLLPALPTRRSAATDDRHRHEPRRHPLRYSRAPT